MNSPPTPPAGSWFPTGSGEPGHGQLPAPPAGWYPAAQSYPFSPPASGAVPPGSLAGRPGGGLPGTTAGRPAAVTFAAAVCFALGAGFAAFGMATVVALALAVRTTNQVTDAFGGQSSSIFASSSIGSDLQSVVSTLVLAAVVSTALAIWLLVGGLAVAGGAEHRTAVAALITTLVLLLFFVLIIHALLLLIAVLPTVALAALLSGTSKNYFRRSAAARP